MHMNVNYLQEFGVLEESYLAPSTPDQFATISDSAQDQCWCGHFCQGVKILSFGVRVVIRDWRGQFWAAKAQKITCEIDPHEAEILAAKQGLTLACELGFKLAILEGDTKHRILLADVSAIATCFNFFKPIM